MGFRDTLVNMVAGSTINRRIKEAVDEKMKETTPQASNSGGKNEDYGFRKLTGTNTKQLNTVDQKKMQKICYWLYDTNGIAHRMAERYKDFVVGDGMSFFCRDNSVMDILVQHWEDDQNRWELKQYQKIMELSIYGEQYFPAFVNDVNGAVRLGYVDPEMVNKVDTDPENPEKQISFEVNFANKPEPRSFKIINLDTEAGSSTFDYLTGEAFFFSINSVANQPRGRSDLLTLADSIDSYEQYLFNRSERSELLTRIIYDLECTGLNQKDIKELLKSLPIPQSNEFFAHNEKVKLDVKSPELGSQDASAEAKLLFNHILAGSGFPPHWFAGGEGLTRATATAMDLPTKKQLKTRQRYFKWMVSRIFRYCIHQAILKKRIDPVLKNIPVKINLPKIEEKETEIIAGALVNLTNSLVAAVEETWITKEMASKVYLYVLSNIGMDIDDDDITEAVTTKESIDARLREIYSRKPRVKAAVEKLFNEHEKEDE